MTIFSEKSKICIICSDEKVLTDYNVDNQNKDKRSNTCKVCKGKAKLLLRKTKRKKIISYMGGTCNRCGYDKYESSLQCHHINPSKKDPRYKNILDWKWKKIIKELDKCELVCANCHINIHSK